MLAYIARHGNIEKPTARKYYAKLMEETKISGTWNTFKCKLRYLKGTLQKANTWRKTKGSEIDDPARVRETLLQLCPHYDQLVVMFGADFNFESSMSNSLWNTEFNHPRSSILSNDDSLNEEYLKSASDSSMDPIDCSDSVFETELHNHQNEVEEPQKPERVPHTPHTDAAKKVDELDYKEAILQLEVEKFQWVKEKELRRMKFEEKKLQAAVELRKLELEQEERIAMYEINMKYKDK
ncbi:uncharacterized protein LOC111067914 isoform X2 [Drosophila obscura]|uniref:uncharacterized protein LOC111067914 isoform X2 n=1 Tax=Drosophila obscura TaxID=7282 RepID=UPI001BB2B41F|nr:uncharacterized protein LOC111067914 isoform X2 [Drosophila obscura]